MAAEEKCGGRKKKKKKKKVGKPIGDPGGTGCPNNVMTEGVKYLQLYTKVYTKVSGR